jgi:hypothetical protein
MSPASLSLDGAITSLSELLAFLTFEAPRALCNVAFGLDFHQPCVAGESSFYLDSDGDIFQTLIFGKVLRSEVCSA